jgi:TPR repeat protein
MYLEGVGVAKSPDEALRLFKLAAARESWGGAACMLGDMYRRGLASGQAPDYGAALSCYTQAARQNNQRAMYQLGLMYEKGLGVSRNLFTARGWYEKALSLPADELLPNYTEQSLSPLDPVAATTAKARRALRRLGG